MVKISRDERFYLEKKGFKFGEALHRTISNVGTYYATESANLLRCLEQYRNSRVVKTVGDDNYPKNTKKRNNYKKKK